MVVCRRLTLALGVKPTEGILDGVVPLGVLLIEGILLEIIPLGVLPIEGILLEIKPLGVPVAGEAIVYILVI